MAINKRATRKTVVAEVRTLQQQVRRLERQVRRLEDERDDILTEEDIRALNEAEEDYRAGRTVTLEEFEKKYRLKKPKRR